MSVELVRPSTKYESSYRAYIVELGDEERYPFPLDFDHKDFPALLRRLNDFEAGRNLPEGYVPSSTYWLVEHGELVGVSKESLTPVATLAWAFGRRRVAVALAICFYRSPSQRRASGASVSCTFTAISTTKRPPE
jgi:hypothetical protein